MREDQNSDVRSLCANIKFLDRRDFPKLNEVIRKVVPKLQTSISELRTKFYQGKDAATPGREQKPKLLFATSVGPIVGQRQLLAPATTLWSGVQLLVYVCLCVCCDIESLEIIDRPLHLKLGPLCCLQTLSVPKTRLASGLFCNTENNKRTIMTRVP